ncbi:MAG: hypothetical protein CMJ65_07090 [Planctomycetaceae bacterium]|jgi:molybdopterin converting factor small subunit|nr:hypothetical protein [Planctomycetaceae bacterium]MDP7277100.1 MoaD/ThiS family protein [Planctomycetaceae bacterium]
MNVTVEYAAQVKQVAGIGSESIELAAPCTIAELARQVAERHGGPLSNILLDGEGAPRRSILVFLGEDQVRWDDDSTLVRDGDTVTLLSPVSGG